MVTGPGRGRGDGDDDLSAGPPPFSDEGMRRIVYGEDRRMVAEALDGSAPDDRPPLSRTPDSRTAAFDEDTAELEADLRSRRNLIPIVTALAAVVCFAAIVWYAYTWGTGQVPNEELPVVRAEPLPEKVKPEQPGGMDVPHQDKLVLNEGTAGQTAPQVEQLLPLPEIPQPPQPLAPPPALAGGAGEGTPPEEAPQLAEAPEAPMTLPGTGPDDIPAPPAESAEAAEELPEAAGESAAEVADGGIAKPIPKPETGAARPDDQIAALLEEEPLETANGGAPAASETPAAAPAPAPAPAATQTAALTTGDVVLQLSSVKSEDAAAREWARLQKAHPDELGGRALALETAEVKGTTYYRVQTGPFASRDAAAQVCAALKARNQDCLVKQR